MPNEKLNQVALVTGVGPGLGASLARGRFAVGLVTRRPDSIAELAYEITDAGGKALSVTADVGRPEEVKSAIARVRGELRKIGLLLHNASSANRAGLAEKNFE